MREDAPANADPAAWKSSAASQHPAGSGASAVAVVLARWFLAGMFIYMGLNKALHPVEFLKLVRQYDVLTNYTWLNFVAATVPWFEVFCGLLLLAGIAVRGTALVVGSLLIAFTTIIWMRALSLQAAGNLPFCSIRFDCGCGGGPVLICRKLVENGFLILLSIGLIFPRRHRWCVRPVLGSAIGKTAAARDGIKRA
jgi:uncharacterized membrane protein YphA (DoxX/SURF4 family)